MERKLEKKDIVGYLSYELCCLNCDERIEIIDKDNVRDLLRGIDLQDEVNDDPFAESLQYKPIIYPIDTLYKTIIHINRLDMNIEETMQLIKEQNEQGNIVIKTIDALSTMPLDDFIKQDADGILYDLNGLESVTYTLAKNDELMEKRWVNDIATAQVIRKLCEIINNK